MTAPRPSQGPQGAPDPEATPGVGSAPSDAAEGDTALRDRMAETLAPLWPTHMSRNVEHHRNQILAAADALLPVVEAWAAEQTQRTREQVAAEARAAAQAIEDSRGENLDPLATTIASGCRVHDTAPAVFDDARTIAIVAYRHLADRIAGPEGT